MSMKFLLHCSCFISCEIIFYLFVLFIKNICSMNTQYLTANIPYRSLGKEKFIYLLSTDNYYLSYWINFVIEDNCDLKISFLFIMTIRIVVVVFLINFFALFVLLALLRNIRSGRSRIKLSYIEIILSVIFGMFLL